MSHIAEENLTLGENLKNQSKPVLIVGAGLSGLSCAITLHKAGIPFRIFEGGDDVGGRVRTDRVDGFLLDRGFQVYLSAYPQAGELLDLPALDLRPFKPGALVFTGKKLHRVMDVFRCPQYLLSSALAPVGSIADKIRVALLRHRVKRASCSSQDQSTQSFLEANGFSADMINTFFRPFYGGIFLEDELRTSKKMFEFTFKMFSEGMATLPAKGMQEIPNQLAARLPKDSIQLNQFVHQVSSNSITLASGEEIQGSHVVVATDAEQSAKLVPGFKAQRPDWRSVTNVYFSAPQSTLKEAIIALNGSQSGLVNNVCVLSDVAPDYAPPGKALISVSLLGQHSRTTLSRTVQTELEDWFGDQVTTWNHLRTDLISKALPQQNPSHQDLGSLLIDGIHLCGDFATSASIEGAIISGKTAAQKILNKISP